MATPRVIPPSLFGINNSNRNFSDEESWGKNIFNSSFPTSLCCFFEKKGLKPIYLSINGNGEYVKSECDIEHVFGISSKSDDIYFSFESVYTPYQPYVLGNLPRIDLVIQRISNGVCLRGLEVKLTALPDNSTCDFEEKRFSSELVVRPDTIVYLACSIIENFGEGLASYLKVSLDDVNNWTEPSEVLKKTDEILESLVSIAISMNQKQLPFLIQPVWKTEGKSPRLSENCLDLFVWSDGGFLWFMTQIAYKVAPQTITRPLRSVVWLYRMLLDYSNNKKFDHKKIIDELSFNTKNDKAFSANGQVTHPFLTSTHLQTPRIKKEEIKKIILGGGQNLLSPERRFDAIVYNSPELFE